MANRARALAAPLRAMCMRAIFDHHQIVLFSNRHDRIHISHLRRQVDYDNRFGRRGDRRFDRLGVDATGLRINIDNHRDAAGGDRCGGGGGKGIGGHDHLVAPADIGSAQGDLHRHRAIHHRHGITTTLQCFKLFGEFLGIRAGIGMATPIARLDNRRHGVNIALIMHRPRWPALFAHRFTTK